MKPPASRIPLLFAALLQIPVLAAQTASTGGAPADETVTLDPFEVKTDSDTSYGALSSRSITAFNTQLDHLPVTADIFDQAFMNDVAATSVEGLLQYSAGAGATGLAAGLSAFSQPGDYRNQVYTQLRGMMTPNMQRDSLMYMGLFGNPGGTAVGTTSNFDLDRVEVIFGPQAMLYDGGGAGGVINAVSKQARLGAPAFGTESFRIDQYGTKYNTFDFGAGSDNFAVRVAGINATDNTRRINIGDHLSGLYAQTAARLWNTVFRVTVEQTMDRQENASGVNLTSAGDPNYKQFNGDDLTYLLATGQAGGIAGGGLNWSNLGSLEGDFASNTTLANFLEVEADSHWTDWLSTQLSAGVSNFTALHDEDLGTVTFYSPGATSNTLPGNWTIGLSSNYSAEATLRPFHDKALRFSALLTRDLFHGRAHSQTIVGADYINAWGAQVPYAYYLADSNWNPVTTGPATVNLGRTVLPALSWTVNSGPVQYPNFRPGSPRITWNGQNYIFQQANPYSPALVNPANPLGTTLLSGAHTLHNEDINDGAYLTNDTSWMDGKLDTLLGARVERSYLTQVNNDTGSPPATFVVSSHNFNFSSGFDYHVRPWLTPYVTVSNSYMLAPQRYDDPAGILDPISEALGEEAGLKINHPGGTVSGSLAFYHNQAKNEEFILTASLLQDIAPTGLNGRAPGVGQGYFANTESDGVQLTLTANPVKNWRIRLSAAYAHGRVQSTRIYAQQYDDQFYQNSQGQVTFADGTVVYVSPAFNSKTPAYTAANAPAGSVPLTVVKLSNPADLYYANPNLTSGSIAIGSDAGKVLSTVDPVHGPIATGATGLPISNLQLVAADIPGLNIPGVIPVAFAGQHTTGYPEVAFVLTSVYQIPNGWFKGIEAGGSVRMGWKELAYYYYPNGLTAGMSSFAQTAFYLPASAVFDPLLGYTRKFRRVTFTSQLNIFNVFNHYRVVIDPDPITGWTNPANLTAAFDQQPRDYVWTNRLSF